MVSSRETQMVDKVIRDFRKKFILKMTLVMTVYQLQMIITSKEKIWVQKIQDDLEDEEIAKALGEESRSSIAQGSLTLLVKHKMKIIVQLTKEERALNLV